MKKKIKIIIIVILLFLLAAVIATALLYHFKYIPERKYSNSHFGIETYHSEHDEDQDGIDDQTDILESARKYVSKRPKYESRYYAGGYPDDGYGVCTDVVAFGLLGAGYDLRTLVNQDIKESPKSYGTDSPEIDIDFRRVKNLKVYFDRHALSLTTDIYDLSEWQGGDIVVFKGHIGIVSDKRNRDGITFVIHHGRPEQRFYEEDILEDRDDILGHYRIG